MDDTMGSMMKFGLYVTNTLVLIASLVLIGMGFWIRFGNGSLQTLLSAATDDQESFDGVYTASVFIICISVVIALVAFLGCFGAKKENRLFLGVYFCAVLFCFVGVVVVAIKAATGDLGFIGDGLKKTMRFYDQNCTANLTTRRVENEAVVGAWDSLQTELKCCGLDGPGDWAEYGCFLNNTYPQSCKSPDNSTVVHAIGCLDKCLEEIADNKVIALPVGLTIVGVLFFNMLFSFAICTRAK